MAGTYIVAVVSIVFGFVYAIVKMAIDHSEKIYRMKHGYPLKDGAAKTEKPANVIDYRDAQSNGGYTQMGR
ncbi:MAG: hypothetical protein LBB94_03210 [Clostridiales bacterium]|jgi:hypothetical protein|nr:hypothetical protein [Clostridiales bacterium]